MSKCKPSILLLSPFFSPNIGGVETHLDDLVSILNEKGYRVYVQTYSPITSPDVKWKSRENKGANVEIRRYSWMGTNLFSKLKKFPLLDFLYITPYLFVRVFWFMVLNHEKIDVIHAHGLNAALIGRCLKKTFKKKLFVSLHSIYEIKPNSITATLIKKILNKADVLSTVSTASCNELVSFGVPPKKLITHKNWIDLNRFKPISDKATLKKKFSLPHNFTVVCIARLIPIKGIREFISVAKSLPQITFLLVGRGPLEKFAKEESTKINNLFYLGSVDYMDLHLYYNLGDIFCIPSQYNEAYGRVSMEAVACGSPVIGSNKGGISEVLGNEVSILVDPTVNNLRKSILQISQSKPLFDELKSNCRNYAEKYFSSKNAETILKSYEINVKQSS
jgi:glycosyltransferase involved in cell wall biosynthesis